MIPNCLMIKVEKLFQSPNYENKTSYLHIIPKEYLKCCFVWQNCGRDEEGEVLSVWNHFASILGCTLNIIPVDWKSSQDRHLVNGLQLTSDPFEGAYKYTFQGIPQGFVFVCVAFQLPWLRPVSKTCWSSWSFS